MTTSAPPKFLRQVHLAERWQRTTRTIARWKDEGVLPEPDLRIHGIPYWAEETIEKVERENFAAKTTAA